MFKYLNLPVKSSILLDGSFSWPINQLVGSQIGRIKNYLLLSETIRTGELAVLHYCRRLADNRWFDAYLETGFIFWGQHSGSLGQNSDVPSYFRTIGIESRF